MRFHHAEVKMLEEQYHAIEIPNEDSVVTYFKIRQQLAKLAKEIQEFVHKPKYCLPFLQPGRLVKVRPYQEQTSPTHLGVWASSSGCPFNEVTFGMC